MKYTLEEAVKIIAKAQLETTARLMSDWYNAGYNEGYKDGWFDKERQKKEW